MAKYEIKLPKQNKNKIKKWSRAIYKKNHRILSSCSFSVDLLRCGKCGKKNIYIYS